MGWSPPAVVRWLFGPPDRGASRLISRWLFLRLLGLIYFSAFFSLVFQIRGLIGPEGILPAAGYLKTLAAQFRPYQRVWLAPTFLWVSASNQMLLALCWAGMAAALLLVFNIWPRGMLVVC